MEEDKNIMGWIPMLLKAYQDAKQALDAKVRELEPQLPKDDSEERTAANAKPSPHRDAPPAQRRNAVQTRAVKKPIRKRKRVLPRNVFVQGPTANWPPRRENNEGYPLVMPTSTKSMLRELRETKRRLNRMESIHTDHLASIHEELKRMQDKLDKRIAEITRALGERSQHRR